MPTYSWMFTCPANTRKVWNVEVEGEAVKFVQVVFPTGPAGLLKVAICYGEKHLWPSGEVEWFRGDGVPIPIEEDWTLPESPCPLRIIAENEDDTYEHMFFVHLKTSPVKPKAKFKFRVAPEGWLEVEVA